jgi:hypothetical protein
VPENGRFSGVTDRPNTSAAGLGGAAAVIVIWLITSLSGVDPPPPVIAAIAALVSTISVECSQVLRGNGKIQIRVKK